MNKYELFLQLRGMQELSKTKQIESLDRVIDDAVWEVASDDWKKRHNYNGEPIEVDGNGTD